MREKIVEQFPKNKIERYIEVFGGAGWIYFSRDRHAPIEVFNDIDHDLINLFQCIKYHAKAVQEELEYHLNSREIFFRYKELIASGRCTDIQRAAMYFVVISESFGANRKNFSTSPLNIMKKINGFSKIQNRLESTIIENKDFEDLIHVYDRPGALFYCDPPYFGAEKYYENRFDLEEHQKLKDVLSSIKGKFVLSYNDDDWIRNLYSGFNIMELERKNTLAAKDNSNIYKEIVIRNFG